MATPGSSPSIYAPPESELAQGPAAPSPWPRLLRIWMAVLNPLVVFPAAMYGLHDNKLIMVLMLGSGTIALVGLFGAARLAVHAGIGWPARALAILGIPAGIVMALFGGLTAMLAVANFTRGRQLRLRGRPQLAPLTPHASWLEDPIEPPSPDDDARAAAHGWRTNGRTEHASVAAFARLSAELIALGAPEQLIREAHEDALDELRHTRLCFQLAERLDGERLGPAALPAAARGFGLVGSRALALARLAIDSLIEGVLLEGVSAHAAAQLAREVTWEPARLVVLQIARDEARHAAHAFHVLEWCVAAGGAPVVHAIRGALDRLPEELENSLNPEAESGRLIGYGLASRALEESSYRHVRERVVARTRRFTEPSAA